MIDSVTFWDFVGCVGVAVALYAAIRAYVGWWLASPRAARTASQIKASGRQVLEIGG